MAKKAAVQQKIVDMELVAKSLAKAVSDGDIVNFRLLFSSFSPARVDSSEEFSTPKYLYLLPDAECEASADFQQALELVRDEGVWKHVCAELSEQRPAQLPYELMLKLADHAVRQNKLTNASQAYELLRVRRRMQDLFYDAGEAALGSGDYSRAVQAYRTASGLAYDYAAFPDPMPLVPNYHTEALKLHGVYPRTPEDCVAAQEEDVHCRVALEFLLPDAAPRLVESSVEVQREFLKHLIEAIDPEWPSFVARYREACAMAESMAKRLSEPQSEESGNGQALREEFEAQVREEAGDLSACLLGRTIEEGTWWQYLKDLAYSHPAAILFIARQRNEKDEVLMPRTRHGSKLPVVLGLIDDGT